MYDIIIIGGGCAGMTAAVYARRAGKTVLLLEGEGFGGQIAFSPRVENFPSLKSVSGSEFANNLYEQVEALGAETGFETVERILDDGSTKTVVTDDGTYECRAVIIASGVKHRHLGVEREQELTGSGVSYCAVCDGVFFKGKTVAVVGGGNTALTQALYLSQLCERVYLIHRRDKFRAEKSLCDAALRRENILPVMCACVTALKGDEELCGITVKDTNSDETRDIDTKGLFVAVGSSPANGAFADVVGLDGEGFIAAGEDCKTDKLGIFVAGDCRTKKVRQLTTAAADGAVAATAACEYIDTL